MQNRVGHALFVAAVKSVRWWRKAMGGLSGVTVHVDRYWSDERHRAAEGWVSAEEEQIEAAEVRDQGRWVEAEALTSRPDLPGQAAKGFTFQWAHGEPMALNFRIKRKGRWTKHALRQPPPDCAERLEVPDGKDLFEPFRKEVNEKHLHVLEIGSRIVSPGSKSKRDLFPGAASFTGFDYYPDDNTDIVGDAHRLSELVGDRRFDAVFSIAVFEHLAMPWVVAAEINRILNPGGLTYHGTVFSWPAHERPWDFWRLSDQGLRVLFAPALGYDIIDAGLFDPVSIHFREIRDGHAAFPCAAGYASASILARKTADVDAARFHWPSDVAQFVGEDHHYPEKNPG